MRAYPPFPGQEKEYLRAMIACIAAATTLCPSGKFTLGEEGDAPTEVEIGEEGRTPPPAAALGELSGWCTRYMGVLDIGRCTNPPSEEEEEEGAPPKPAVQPHIPYLSPLSEGEWCAATYTQGGPPVAIARCLKWPGAYCAYQLAKSGAYGQEVLSSLYVGYGHAMLPAPFVMEAPPPFEAEPAEVHESADLPLADENALFIAAKTEEIAAEAAELPDPEPVE